MKPENHNVTPHMDEFVESRVRSLEETRLQLKAVGVDGIFKLTTTEEQRAWLLGSYETLQLNLALLQGVLAADVERSKRAK